MYMKSKKTLAALSILGGVTLYPQLGWSDTGLNVDGVGLYNPLRSRFFLKDNLASTNADYAFDYGQSNIDWIPLAGDWNGDGADTIGLYDPRNSLFNLSNGLGGNSDYVFNFGPGNAGWVPLAGDWNGDGADTIGLYNPARSRFFLKDTLDGADANYAFDFGPANVGWTPIAGDWNGDGTDTIGLHDPLSSTFYLSNNLGGGDANYVFNFGPSNSGWIPMTGDWNGDGIDTIGLYDPIGAGFYLANNLTGGQADNVFSFGPSGLGWVPLSGGWSGHETAAPKNSIYTTENGVEIFVEIEGQDYFFTDHCAFSSTVFNNTGIIKDVVVFLEAFDIAGEKLSGSSIGAYLRPGMSESSYNPLGFSYKDDRYMDCNDIGYWGFSWVIVNDVLF